MTDLELGHPVFDGDNHYYEALDAFTRYLPAGMGRRCVEWCEIDGRSYQVLGGRVSHAVANPTFDPIAKPGCMHEYFRGNPNNVNPLDLLKDREPIRAEYRDPVARTKTLDEQGLSGCWMFPTLGMIYEESLAHDPEAVCITFRAFNRWLLDDWGFNHDDRIYTAPYLTLADGDWAVDELEWALDNGARMIVMRPAAPTTATGRCSPFDDRFAAFWSRVNEAGITVVVHAGDSGGSAQGYAPDGFAADFKSGGGGGWKPSIKMFAIEQAIHDYLLSMMLENHVRTYPNLRVAAVENGAEFLGDLFRKLRSMDKKAPGYFGGDPVELFREHVWINPFWEDDVEQIVDWMGADRVVFGSDWPHIEGMPAPLDYVPETKALDPSARRKVLHDNAVELTTLRPAAAG